MQDPVTLSVRDGLATLRICREHGNAINGDFVEALLARLAEIERDGAVRGVLLAATGKLFCPGLDLQELTALDRPTMERFLRRFSEAMTRLFALPRPVVVALHGHALAGGCVLALTGDRRVLRHGAMIGLNEVRVGVPLPWAVTLLLAHAVNPTYAEEIALIGRNYSDGGALAAGLAHELHPAEGFEEHCRARLAEFADRDLRAFAITKRYLRSATVARIAAEDPTYAGEFLDAWFSRETRERIGAVVAGLGK